MKGPSRMEKRMVMVKSPSPDLTHMRECGRMDYKMDRGRTNMVTEMSMKASGKME